MFVCDCLLLQKICRAYSRAVSNQPRQSHTPMRTYPLNSPYAAARIVALTLLADGHLCKAEIDALERLNVHDTLGLGKDELHRVLHSL